MSSNAIVRNESNLRLQSLNILETLAPASHYRIHRAANILAGDYRHQAASKSLYNGYHIPADA